MVFDTGDKFNQWDKIIFTTNGVGKTISRYKIMNSDFYLHLTQKSTQNGWKKPQYKNPNYKTPRIKYKGKASGHQI